MSTQLYFQEIAKMSAEFDASVYLGPADRIVAAIDP